MKKIFLIAVFASLFYQALACEIKVKLNGQIIRPNSNISLTQGTVYTLTVSFTPDHFNCPVKPEETIFLLDDEKWKANKDYQTLALISTITWKEVAPRQYEATISFKALKSGTATLEILRECSKGGYSEKWFFNVK